ncbi:MAG: precorrin-3B C(17)-methyltransferase [Desulfovibrionaceae bacterium]
MVGLGPGGPQHLTPAARQALAQADVVAGYKGYMELVEPELLAGKQLISTGMTGEVERAGAALDAALAGARVAVVSSGDPGIYAMAGLILEMLESRGLMNKVDFDVLPGVPAFCAAAALLGAPLMHDFASVSLSDLLTPWPLIEKRLEAAASADFVIAIYNPRSRRRSGHLEKALQIISRHRGPETPVGVVSRAMRPDQTVSTFRLDAVDVTAVDMQTIIIIGNSSTRKIAGRLLTPRGYNAKYALT